MYVFSFYKRPYLDCTFAISLLFFAVISILQYSPSFKCAWWQWVSNLIPESWDKISPHVLFPSLPLPFLPPWMRLQLSWLSQQGGGEIKSENCLFLPRLSKLKIRRQYCRSCTYNSLKNHMFNMGESCVFLSWYRDLRGGGIWLIQLRLLS